MQRQSACPPDNITDKTTINDATNEEGRER